MKRSVYHKIRGNVVLTTLTSYKLLEIERLRSIERSPFDLSLSIACN
jgi:hypothetical protein